MGYGAVSVGRLFDLLLFVVERHQYIGKGEDELSSICYGLSDQTLFLFALEQVVWFTALFPYVVLFILLIRGITLPGSAEGIKYYLYPNFDAIYKAEVWAEFLDKMFGINLL